MKRTLSWILALALLISSMPMQVFAAEGAEPITEPTETTENVEESEAAEILRQAAKDAIFPLGNISGNIAVLGDSTISGYPQYSALSTYLSVADGYTVTDISKAGDTVAGQLNKWNALSVEAKNSLNYVFVQIGLNDMRNLTPESFRTRYKGLIAQIRADSPDAMLILGTMVPCKARWKYLEPNNWEEVQARWESANEDIKNFYYDCDRVAYLHTDALGQDDNLRTEYDHGDHIHPNASGAKVIAYSWYLAAIGHSHRYNSTVTAPTCTEQGYTTYTCACGDSYVADYVDATGHSYKNGICAECDKCAVSEAEFAMDLFVFAGQSNMMGAAVLEPEVNTFTDQSWEYKYMPKLRGAETGAFVPAQNPAGEWHYKDMSAAYGDRLQDLSYKATVSNYSSSTYFCPAMSNGTKGFSAQSEADTYPSASLPPYFVTEYASYGHASVYAHMAKGAVKIVHYFTEEMMTRYNALILEYNTENNKSYSMLTSAGLSGAGDAFDEKFNAMLEDYAALAPDNALENKCFVWLQGEGDSGNSYIEYKFKMQVLWEHLQKLGFTHFFVLRVGYWGSAGILNVIKAQEDFCAENENCYIVTRAPSLIPYPGATTDNWWISEPSAEYDGCRDSYLVDSSNNHFNEKAMQIFAERSAENVHRILHLGLEPVLEEENIRGMQKEEELPEDDTPYTSYVGTEVFRNKVSISKVGGTWKEQQYNAASTDLIPISSDDSVWIQYVFFKSDAHAVGGFYDADGQLVAPLWYEDFGFTADPNTGGVTAFRTPVKTNRVSVADLEAATGKKIAYVRFTAWAASAGGHAGTEARIYHEEHTHSYDSVVTAPTCTEQGYTTYTCACGDSYVADYVDALGHEYGEWTEVKAPTCDTEGKDKRICDTCGDVQYRDTRISGDPNKILVSNPVAEDYFAGKTVLLIGDSITAGVGTTKTYGVYLSESLGVTVTNKGSSGSGYCSGGAMATNKNLTEANVRNADIITIMLGVNDWNWAVKEGSWRGNPEYYDKSQTYYQLGDFHSTDTSTFYGALHAWCQKILTMQQIDGFEDKQFIVITPLITSWNVSVTGRKDWDQDKLNIHGHTFREYCTAIMEVCAYYDIPVFDANMFSGIYYKSAEDNNVTETGGDGVHVSAAGHALLAESLEEFLLEGYSYEKRTVVDCGHRYETVIVQSTCTEDGYTIHKCPVCHYNYTDNYVDALGHKYANGTCTGCGAKEPSESMSLRFDDHVDMTGKTVEIIDAGTPTSYKVGYGVAEGTLDDAVVTLEGNYLVATGIGTAKVKIDGTLYEVTVESAPISLLLLIGQSNMRGSEGNADQSIVCPEGMVYATFGDDRGDAAGIMNVNNATNFAASALTGEYSAINVNGTTDNLSFYPIYSLTEAGGGTFGPDSGFAYEWVQQTGEKVWIVNAAHGGSSITSWKEGATNFKECDLLFSACQETLRKEIAAGHFTLSHMGYFWCQGCSDYSWTAEKYAAAYLAMHESLKKSLAFDHDSDVATPDITLEFAGIIPVRAGHDYNDGYREDIYTDTTTQRFYESFLDLQMTGPRVAQYWMCNNPELEDIWMVCNVGEDWVWMPDGTNGVTEYFQAHYANGTVDYTTQVAQKAAWYTPTAPKEMHDSIHYNQIGYNEVGREAARNALILMGEIEAPDVETTVELVGWDGYSRVTSVDAYTEGRSTTLVVPKVYPVWRSKEVTYTLSDGLIWNYYDLLVTDDSVGGMLTSSATTQTVTVTGHTWSEWETLSEASAEGPGEQRRTCGHCGKTETRYVDGVWQIYALNDHLLELPEHVCCDTNLWAILPHESVHFTSGKKWGNTSTPVTSITIPVNPGDKLYATSWNKAGENGHATSDGIRLTFFDAKGIALTLGPGESYRQFAANGGYLVAPEGTIAINIAMWYDSEEYEVYILNRDHTYKNGICTGCGSSVLDGNYTHAIPENQGVQNAIDRAYSLTDVEWTPLADVPGVKKINGEFTVVPFEAGVTYKGIPYSGVTANDCYVGLNVSLESFLTALENKNSVLYTENLFSTNPKSATYFGTVCSKFAQYVLDVPGSYNTNNVANIPGMETIALPGDYTVDQIKLGDVVLHTQNHTSVCTDILYDADGNVAFIEISEAVLPLCRRMYWSPEEFYEHFAGYRLCRYQYIDQTPAIDATTLTDDYALMPRFGDKYNYKVSSTKGVVDVLESGYHKAVILRDGVVIDEIVLGGATSFVFDRSVPGYLEMYLEKQDGTRSGSVYACVVKSSVTVTNTSRFTQGNLTVMIDGSCGTPVYVQVGSAHAIFCNVEGKTGTVEISFPFSKVSSKQVRVAYQNEYGIYLSDWSGFTVDYGAGTGPNPSSDPLISQATFWEGHNITPSNHLPVIQENKPGYWSYTMIPVAENTTYYSLGATRLWYLDSSGNPISTFNAYKEGAVPFQFTTPQGAAYVNIAYSPNFLSPGQEQMSHPHNWQEGICTECGEADPDYHIPGDINGDGDINNKDLIRLHKYLSEYEVEVVEAALDVNGDGTVNNKDMIRLHRYLSGWDVEIA